VEKVLSFDDAELKLTIVLDGKEIAEDVVDLNLLWSEACDYEGDLAMKYERFRLALTSRWGVEVGKGTAFMVVQRHTEMLTKLKKTQCVLAS
jgi:hypothetical protein